MCDVCVAGQAYDMKEKGLRIVWTGVSENAEDIAEREAYSAKIRSKWGGRKSRRRAAPERKLPPHSGAVPVYFRVKDVNDKKRGVEGPGRYQIRREGEKWPRRWEATDDVAGIALRYGFDVKWYAVPKAVREWVRGRAPLPDVASVGR